ncbi:MAG TPA: NADH-quinone oxidoreductase subunit C [Nitrososphaeraceae archaeon]|nr:NADH-quinone oxidoreductase subunit C [Nitrososphaeraceae archaeon]
MTSEPKEKPVNPSSPQSSPSSTAAPKPATQPPKQEPEAPPFEKEIVSQIISHFGNDKIKVSYIRPLRIKIRVDPANIVEVATFIRDNLLFDHAEAVSGTDYPKDDQIEVIYQLGSYSRDDMEGHIFSLATRTSRDDARLPSLINVFKSAEYHERETFEMLGVYFEGHPRNERFILPEDWADLPPLRKEFRIRGR